MSVNKNEELFESALLAETEQLIRAEFGAGDLGPCFHYTSLDSMAKIYDSKTFWASFIRSTSDPLEFALPLSACRDWLCIEQKFLSFPNFPTRLFHHFNEQANDPIARYYFISISADSKNKHLKDLYGDGILKFDLSTLSSDFDANGMMLKCRYVENIESEVFNLMEKWRDLFDSKVNEFSIEKPEQKMKIWLYIFMRYCHSISLGLKKKSFENECELRIVLVSRDASSDSTWHTPRNARPVSEKSLLVREGSLKSYW